MIAVSVVLRGLWSSELWVVTHKRYWSRGQASGIKFPVQILYEKQVSNEVPTDNLFF